MEDTANNFLTYLENLGVSKKTLKNYKSDLKHFTGWLLVKIRSWGATADNLSEAVPYLSSQIAKEYRAFLAQAQTPFKTINRRLSTLRHLSKFLRSQNLISQGFAAELTNVLPTSNIKNIHPKYIERHQIDHMMESFASHLEKQKLSQNTIKNYLSDIRHFANYLKSQ